MLKFEDLTMIFGNKLLFSDINLVLKEGKKYALVGGNGVGKSTLINLILSNVIPTAGDIIVNKKMKISEISQDQFKYDDYQIIDIVMMGKEELYKKISRKNEIYSKIDFSDDEGMELAEIENYIYEVDEYDAEDKAKEFLEGLGLIKEDFNKKLSELSGGNKIRVLLAKAIYSDPDLLILDEPNNHLDIVAIDWLENYLKNTFNKTLIVTSHEYNFLENICDAVIDIDYGEINTYYTKFSKYEVEKQENIERKIIERNKLSKKKERMLSIINRFRAGTRAKQAQSLEKMMNKIELPDINKSSRREPKINFDIKSKSAKKPIIAKNLSKSYGNKVIFKNLSFDLIRGDKLAVIGANGIGKSTLLKMIMNDTDYKGEIELNCNPSYFEQNHDFGRYNDSTVIEYLRNATNIFENNTLFSALGVLGLEKDASSKHIGDLSGGEKTKLLFAKISLEKRNLLVLDEPTNHLDLESRNALKIALKKYDGAIAFVSHDKDFINKVATKILFLRADRQIFCDGKYEDFVTKYARILS